MSNDSWEYDVGLTNAPPRRRTEPAITADLAQAHGFMAQIAALQDRMYQQQMLVAQRENDERIEAMFRSLGWTSMPSSPLFAKVPKPVKVMALHFEPAEVEACKVHGSDRYASQAMVCDEAREAAYVEQWRKDREAEGYLWTDGDEAGYMETQSARLIEHFREGARLYRASLTMPLPNESPGDYAARHGMDTADELCLTFASWAERVRLEMAAVERGEPV